MLPLPRLLCRLPLWLIAVLLAACAQLPPLQGRTESSALPAAVAASTRLGRTVAPMAAAHPGLTGVLPLAAGHDAFAARYALVEAAERTLDLQYYTWREDLSGGLLLDAVRRAADRGVRVRMLLDDHGTAGMDERLRALDAHAQIEVRLFNPFPNRGARMLDYLGDFSRVNRRMHNKSFTVDNQATVVGGRNIGDEYFAAGEGTLFIDFDVMAIGQAVAAVSRDFDRYWQSEAAYPLDRIIASVPASQPPAKPRAQASEAGYRQAIANSSFVRDLIAGQLQLEWTTVRLISDDPGKALGDVAATGLLWTQLLQVVPRPAQHLMLISPYFVPTARGTELLCALARDGVQVLVVTNALEATDVPLVHSGYARWRAPLLAGGVELYELKRASAERPDRDLFFGGSSGASLHAKVVVFDRQRLFVGSFNFDPRSARLNTELGLVIESAALAGEVARRASASLPERTYSLRLHEGRVRWSERRGDGEALFDRDPNTGWLLRLGVSVLSLLPIEDLL